VKRRSNSLRWISLVQAQLAGLDFVPDGFGLVE